MTAVLAILAISFVIVMLQEKIYARFWKKNLQLNIYFSKKRVFEGETAQLTEEIINKKVLPMPWISVKFSVSSALSFKDMTNTAVSDYFYRNDLFSIARYQKITRNLDFVCKNRGYYNIKSASLSSSNILMSKRLAEEVPIDAYITVYPRLIDVSSLEADSKKLLGDAFAKRFINPDPFQIKSIREYIPTDEFKNINFKASAKTGSLMVSVKDHTVSQEIIIILNMESAGSWLIDSVFEDTIRLAASITEFYVNKGIATALISNGRDVITGDTIYIESGSSGQHLNYIYESLARIDKKKDIEKMSSAIGWQGAKGDNEKVYVFISAYYGKDMQQLYESIKMDFSAMWIIPAMLGDEIKLDIPFIRWDVDINDNG